MTDPLELGRPPIRVITDRDGLPQNSVMSMAFDHDGYLWVTTQDGAAYYNGHVWTTVDMPEKEKSNFVRFILIASDGSKWFARAAAGLARLNDGQWTTYDTSNGLPHNEVWNLVESRSADGLPIIWAGTSNGLGRFENGQWTTYDTSNGLPHNSVWSLLATPAADGSDEVWAGTSAGLARLTRSGWTVYDSKTGLPHDRVFSLLRTIDDDGAAVVWAGMRGGHVARFKNGAWQSLETSQLLKESEIYYLLETRMKNGARALWVATRGAGLARYMNGQWRIYDEDSGLPANSVWWLAATSSSEGLQTLWIGTFGGGLARLDQGKWHTFDDETGLPSKDVYGMAESVEPDGSRAIWLATRSGLAQLSNGKWRRFNTSNGLVSNEVYVVKHAPGEDGKPALWAGTLDAGLMKYQNGSWKNYTTQSGLPNNRITHLLATTADDGDPVLWVGTRAGLARLKDGQWRSYVKGAGFENDTVMSLCETVAPDGRRTLWVGTNGGGLAKMVDDRWTTYGTESGLPNARIQTLLTTRDESGRELLWAGTGGGGIAVLDLGSDKIEWEILSDSTTPAIPNNVVYKLAKDAQNRIYVYTNRGVARLTPRTPTPDDPARFRVYTFTTDDGLPSNECNQSGALIDSAGRVWAGTVEGAAVLDPALEVLSDNAKPLYVERILIGDEEHAIPRNAALSYNQNSMVFEFALLSYYRESATRYRTHMVGLEEKPTQWIAEHRRDFSYLPAGSYVFKIWGKDYAGNVTGPIEIPFEVLPAPWRSWWAYALYVLLFAALVGGITFAVYRARVMRLLEVERVRTRIATDLHDDIGASLSQISILSEVLQQNSNGEVDPKTTKALSTIAATSREMVDSMSDIVWAMNPNRDSLRDLIQRMRRFASDILSARDIAFHFRTPEVGDSIRVGADVRREVYLIFKESVNNAAKHSGASTIEIDFSLEGSSLRMRLRDDGRGFDTSNESDGNGLYSMKQRAERLGGTLDLESEPGVGTTISLEVPISRSANWYLSTRS